MLDIAQGEEVNRSTKSEEYTIDCIYVCIVYTSGVNYDVQCNMSIDIYVHVYVND